MGDHKQSIQGILFVIVTMGFPQLVCADTIFTSFESPESGSFSIGTSPLTATFMNGAAETRGNPALYKSGAFAWHISPATTGVAALETPASAVAFHFRDAANGGDSIARVLDTDNREITSIAGKLSFLKVDVTRNTGQTLISRIEIENNGTPDVAVDDFSFTADAGGMLSDPIPEAIPRGGITINLTEVASGLVAPNWGTSSPTDPNRLFIVDQVGIIWSLDLSAGNRSVFLDVRNRLVALGISGPGSFDERGLLGLALHPDYERNGLLYTYTSEPANRSADFSTIPSNATADHQSVITEWRVPAPMNPASRPTQASARELMRIDQPQFNHDGGALNFGPDGHLYIALGDGGGRDDEGPGHGSTGNGQDLSNPLGALLRINPLGSNAVNGRYGIPADNPFVSDNNVVQEIYAYGYRNPFRFSFDKMTGALWLADVGQDDIEEINTVAAGENYGWNFKEGSFFFDPNGNNPGFVTTVDPGVPGGLVDPVAEYDHDEGIAIIGGFVYRGAVIEALQSRYVFGDFGLAGEGRLFYLTPSNAIREFNIRGRDNVGMALNGFAQDADGELYALANTTGTPSGNTGAVLRIDPVTVATIAAENLVMNLPVVDVLGQVSVNANLVWVEPLGALEFAFRDIALTSVVAASPARFINGRVQVPVLEVLAGGRVIARFEAELTPIPGTNRVKLTRLLPLP